MGQVDEDGAAGSYDPLAEIASPWRRRAIEGFLAALRLTTRVSPRPTVWAVNELFTRTSGETAAVLRAHAPVDVVVWPDEPYGPGADEVLDVYVPAAEARPGNQLPTVVWVHGGAFVGGSKDQLAGWFRVLADAAGVAVVAPRYTLAPTGRYPTPVRQVAAAIAHVAHDPARFHVDLDRVVLAGDSAGAHIASQLACCTVEPDLARALGVAVPSSPAQLRGALLCCGVYDTDLMDHASPVAWLLEAILWAYAGVRHPLRDPSFTSTASVVDHVTPRFPPSFVTVGDADPLRPHTESLLERLRACGVEVDALTFEPGHQPPLAHEYQFELDHPAAQEALARMVAFLQRCTSGVGAAAVGGGAGSG